MLTLTALFTGIISVVYSYLFLKKYIGKFRQPMEYFFLSTIFFSTLIMEYMSAELFPIYKNFITNLIPITTVANFIFLAMGTRSAYLSIGEIKLESLLEERSLLNKQSKLLTQEFYRRRIDEEVFKILKMEIEREFIRVDSKILQLKEQIKKGIKKTKKK